jgi:hypothetical protein
VTAHITTETCVTVNIECFSVVGTYFIFAFQQFGIILTLLIGEVLLRRIPLLLTRPIRPYVLLRRFVSEPLRFLAQLILMSRSYCMLD